MSAQRPLDPLPRSLLESHEAKGREDAAAGKSPRPPYRQDAAIAYWRSYRAAARELHATANNKEE